MIYTGNNLREIRFPLGGIGTGTIALGGRGQLTDFEIFNKPGKNKPFPPAFFAIRVDDKANNNNWVRVLEREFFPPYTGHWGVDVNKCPGLPRFSEVEFIGEYSLA